jgi:hypothetical protein
LKPFTLNKHQDASAWMQHSHRTNLFLFRKSNKGFFLYYISCKEK